MNVRQNTDKLLDMIEEGMIDKDVVILACLKYMSEDDVTDMMHANDIEASFEEDDEDYDDILDIDDWNSTSSRHHY